MAKSLVSLDVIASNICGGMGDSTNRFKFTILRHLLSVYRGLNLFLNQDTEIKTAVLEYDNAVDLPCDFVYETKVGIRDIESGRIAVLSLDKSIGKEKLNQKNSVNRVNEIFSGAYGGDGYLFYNAFRGGEFLGELYGYGRGVISSGFYNLNRKDGVIYIGSLLPKNSEIVIEYKSDGISDGLKLVPSELEDVLSYGAKARFYEERRDFTAATWNEQRYEQKYNKTQRLYNFRTSLYMSAAVNEMFSSTNY